MRKEWFGAEAAWWAPFERDARRRYGELLTIVLAHRRVTYRHAGLEVPGRFAAIPVTVEFYAAPPYDCYGLSAQDYPRVFADPGVSSPHRMPDDSLCLFFPRDGERRWRSEDGLLSLLNITRDHLFFELHWRESRGRSWLGPEAPHGLPGKRAA